MLKSCLTVALLHCAARAYYLPGAAPQEFSVGAPIPIFATKMTSVKTQLPFRYFHLKFCAPTANDEQYQSNLGELLKGDVNELTAYSLEMQVPKACQVLCQQLWQPADRRRYIEAIDDEYVVHLTADNLPAATKMPGDSHVSVGLPLGSLTVNHNHLVYNHLDITIRVHPMDAGRTARVVGFEVVPKSILHENMKELHCDSQLRPTIVEELKPRDDVVFTYSVEFVESPIAWATRWDAYLSSPDINPQIHWFSILNSLIILFLLSGIVGVILLRTLLRDISRYNEPRDAEEFVEEGGWRLVHGDVFRKPHYSKLLAVCSGGGVQLYGMSACTIAFAMLGFLSPSSRGSLLVCMLVLFALMGFPAGYVSSRFNKRFDPDTERSIRVSLATALLFPGVCFGTLLLLNSVVKQAGSSGALSFGTMFKLLLMWFGLSVPLVLLGSFIGYKAPQISVPVRTNQIPRSIPPQPWMYHPLVAHAATGMLPFGAIFTELLFIMSSVWHHQFYYLFGFLFLVLVILTVTCAEISIAFTYFQLCAQDYRWWWRSYWCSASSAIYFLVYGVVYFFTHLQTKRWEAAALYFGYMAIAAYGFFLVTGAIGFVATFLLVRSVYGAVKVE
eukprot:Polyplicarium_translucidae@DN2934_c0_g1_i3.p1